MVTMGIAVIVPEKWMGNLFSPAPGLWAGTELFGFGFGGQGCTYFSLFLPHMEEPWPRARVAPGNWQDTAPADIKQFNAYSGLWAW